MQITSSKTQDALNEYVLRARCGDPEALSSLWTQVERFVRSRATRWAGYLPAFVDVDDLMQVAYGVLHKAVCYYDEQAGAGFLSVYAYFLHRAFASACCLANTSTGLRPRSLECRTSLDAPISDDSESETPLSDLVPDSSAGPIDEGVIARQAHDLLCAALDGLPADERQAIQCMYWRGMTQQQTAETLGVNIRNVRRLEAQALRHLREGKSARELKEMLVG